jgi:hypothetical protein
LLDLLANRHESRALLLLRRIDPDDLRCRRKTAGHNERSRKCDKAMR